VHGKLSIKEGKRKPKILVSGKNNVTREENPFHKATGVKQKLARGRRDQFNRCPGGQ